MKNEKLWSGICRRFSGLKQIGNVLRTPEFFIFIFSFFILSFAACGERQEIKKTGGAVFDISPEIIAARVDTLIDIGIVRSGEILLYNASLRNTGEEPLVIKNVNTSCGCTSVEYEKQPIAPGQEGNLSLRFDSKGMAGMQIKLIEISTSAGTYPYQVLLRIEVTGNENF